LLTETLGEEAATEMVKATKSVNYIREKLNIPPLKIDAEKAQAAQDYLVDFIINENKPKRRRLSSETDGCGKNIFKSTDPNVD